MKATCGSVARLSLGAYVLGALDPIERTEVEAHLSECAACRDELAGLAALPGLLSRVRVEDVLDPLPSRPAMAERLVERMRTARRARRQRLAAAASALAIATAAAGVIVLATQDTGRSGPQGDVAFVSAASPRTGVAVKIALRPTSWGTAVRVRLRGVPPATRCRLIVHSRSGRREVAGTWRATYDGTARLKTATAIPRDQLASFEVVTAAGRRLVRAPLD